MGQVDEQRIELLVLGDAEAFGDFHLQVHRLDRLASAGHGDPVLVRELLHALVGVAADEEDRQSAKRTDALYVDTAARLVPGDDHRRNAAGADMDRAGDQPVVDRHGIAEHGPLGRQGEACLGSVLLDQFLVQHDGERQVANAELAHDVHLAHLCTRWAGPGHHRSAQCRCKQRSAIDHHRCPPILVHV